MGTTDMEVIGGRIREYPGYANPPTLIVQVDKVPEPDQFIYRKLDMGSYVLYFAEKDGEVRFYSHNLKNESGYGGSTFHLPMEDGSWAHIRGPWSSRAGVMRRFFEDCVDVEIHPIAGHKFYGHVTIAAAQDAIAYTGLKLVLVDGAEPHWEVGR